jgi:hypothetical protein
MYFLTDSFSCYLIVIYLLYCYIIVIYIQTDGQSILVALCRVGNVLEIWGAGGKQNNRGRF